MRILSRTMSPSVWGAWLLCACLALAGCASAPPVHDHAPPGWSGRLSLTLDKASPSGQTQSFSARFHLTGSAQQGRLDLFSPLGTTLAHIRWTPTSATAQQGAFAREYPDIDTLLHDVAGASLPLSALLNWLDGQPAAAPGWQADLSEHAQGRIRATRHQPLPAATIRVILDPLDPPIPPPSRTS